MSVQIPLPNLPPCAIIAERTYGISHDELQAHLKFVQDKKLQGSGYFKINPRWLPWLSMVGFDSSKIQTDICMNIAATAWIMAWGKLKKEQQITTAKKGKYHIPQFINQPYGKECINDAVRQNNIEKSLFLAILKTEGGHHGQEVKNKNGTYDLGIAQINSSWLHKLGLTSSQLLNDDCLNIHVGAWILGQEMYGKDPQKDPQGFWRAVGNYNSHTPVFNVAYQAKVWKNLHSKSQ